MDDVDRESNAVGYAALVRAAGAVATCAYADTKLAKLSVRFLCAELKRWGEFEDGEDE